MASNRLLQSLSRDSSVMKLWSLVFALSLPLAGLGQAVPAGKAQTMGPCSPAISGNHNTINYNGDCPPGAEIENNRILNSRAYDALSDALKTVGSISQEWTFDVSNCQFQPSRFRGVKYATALQIYREEYHFCILQSETTLKSKWNTGRTKITKSINDAIGRVEANEQETLPTINQREAWKDKYERTLIAEQKDAMKWADHDPTIEDLVRNDDNNDGIVQLTKYLCDRFAPLKKYLQELRTKVGGYPSQ